MVLEKMQGYQEIKSTNRKFRFHDEKQDFASVLGAARKPWYLAATRYWLDEPLNLSGFRDDLAESVRYLLPSAWAVYSFLRKLSSSLSAGTSNFYIRFCPKQLA